MGYSQKFVACVLVKGEPQRELANGTVPIPFGTEYALRFRNKHDRRAVVQIFIDGENVSGAGYVIQARSSVDIRRHADKDVAFKFVSLDSADAVEHGKNGPNPDKVKGTIEARFFLEKKAPPAPKVIEHHHHHYPRPWRSYPWVEPLWQYEPPYGTWCGGSSGSIGGSSYTMTNLSNAGGAGDDIKMSARSAKLGDQSIRCMSLNAAPPQMDSLQEGVAAAFVAAVAPAGDLKDGCTVEGNYTGQTFWETHVDLEEDYVSVKLFLQGYEQAAAPVVKKPILLCETKTSPKPVQDLERENEDLRRRIAEMEREQLEKKLKRLSKSAK